MSLFHSVKTAAQKNKKVLLEFEDNPHNVQSHVWWWDLGINGLVQMMDLLYADGVLGVLSAAMADQVRAVDPVDELCLCLEPLHGPCVPVTQRPKPGVKLIRARVTHPSKKANEKPIFIPFVCTLRHSTINTLGDFSVQPPFHLILVYLSLVYLEFIQIRCGREASTVLLAHTEVWPLLPCPKCKWFWQ